MMTPPNLPRHSGGAGTQVVVMGVAGTGKTTVARRLAEHLSWAFLEGDNLHPPANIAKMSAGVPLDDHDRAPWLEALRQEIAGRRADGLSSVLTCSALRRSYRDALRAGTDTIAVLFVQLSAPYDVLLARLEAREHFMPPTLLASQLATLEPLEADEHGLVVDASRPLAEVVTQTVVAIKRMLDPDVG